MLIFTLDLQECISSSPRAPSLGSIFPASDVTLRETRSSTRKGWACAPSLLNPLPGCFSPRTPPTPRAFLTPDRPASLANVSFLCVHFCCCSRWHFRDSQHGGSSIPLSCFSSGFSSSMKFVLVGLYYGLVAPGAPWENPGTAPPTLDCLPVLQLFEVSFTLDSQPRA